MSAMFPDSGAASLSCRRVVCRPTMSLSMKTAEDVRDIEIKYNMVTAGVDIRYHRHASLEQAQGILSTARLARAPARYCLTHYCQSGQKLSRRF